MRQLAGDETAEPSPQCKHLAFSVLLVGLFLASGADSVDPRPHEEEEEEERGCSLLVRLPMLSTISSSRQQQGHQIEQVFGAESS